MIFFSVFCFILFCFSVQCSQETQLSTLLIQKHYYLEVTMSHFNKYNLKTSKKTIWNNISIWVSGPIRETKWPRLGKHSPEATNLMNKYFWHWCCSFLGKVIFPFIKQFYFVFVFIKYYFPKDRIWGHFSTTKPEGLCLTPWAPTNLLKGGVVRVWGAN